MSHESYRGVYTASRVFAAMIIAISGGLTWIGMEVLLGFEAPLELQSMVRLTTAGAFAGGWLFSPLFGRPGTVGACLTCLGALMATGIGAFLVGTALEGPDDAVFAAILVYAALVANPAIGGTWLAMMLLANAAAGDVRPESSG